MVPAVPGRVEPAADPKRTLGDADQLAAECAALETELTELKAAYEQYFLGVERIPPTRRHDALHKRVLGLKGQFIRQTAVKFRIQTLSSRLTTYERLWERTKLEIEAGTYRRDLFRAKRHQQARQQKPASAIAAAHLDEDLDLTDLDETPPPGPRPADAPPTAAAPPAAPPARPGVPAVAPVRASPAAPGVPAASPAGTAARPPTPVPPIAPVGPPRVPAVAPVAARPPAVAAAPPPRPVVTPPFGPAPARPATGGPTPVSASGGLTDQKIKAIYEAYVMAKKRCGEDTRSLTLDSVASSLKKQVPELMKQHKARSVEFKVVIKDGRAVLRALPKDS